MEWGKNVDSQTNIHPCGTPLESLALVLTNDLDLKSNQDGPTTLTQNNKLFHSMYIVQPEQLYMAVFAGNF